MNLQVGRTGARLLASFATLILVLVLGVALASGLVLRGVFLDNLEHDLGDHAQAIAAALRAGPAKDLVAGGDLSTLRAFADTVGAETDVRITVIAADGTVLADSFEDPDLMGDHSERPEVVVALAGGLGRALRYSVTTGHETVYVAAPIGDSPGAPWDGGVVRAATADRAGQLMGRVLLIPVLVGLFALIPTAVVAFLISRSLTGPIERLRTMAVRVAEGDLSYRVATPTRTDELGQLARALNAMASELEDRVSELQGERERMADILASMTDGVLLVDEQGVVNGVNPACARMLESTPEEMLGGPIVHTARSFPAQPLVDEALATCSPFVRRIELPGDRTFTVQVTPLSTPGDGCRQALMVLQDATERTRLDRLRKDFVANVSHELKTPLSGIALLAGTIKTSVTEDPEAVRGFAERLEVEVGRLTGLVDDLLVLSEIEDQRESARLRLERVDVDAIAREVVASLEVQARKLDLDLTLISAGPTYLAADGAAVTTMLRNLVDNALRYTDPGGSVTLSVQPDADAVHLTVKDDGIGIPRDDRERVFERFYRVDKARSRETGGTGLGLSIVKNAAEAHGGSVGLESAVGVGSTFTVTLPRRQPPGVEA